MRRGGLHPGIGEVFWESHGQHGGRPSLLRIQTAGHQFVKADWKRFSPAKMVKMSQYGEWIHARTALVVTTTPAISRKPRSIVIAMTSLLGRLIKPLQNRYAHNRLSLTLG